LAWTLPFTLATWALGAAFGWTAGLGTVFAIGAGSLGLGLFAGHLHSLRGFRPAESAIAFRRMTLWYASGITMALLLAESARGF
jgi:hypothetical protein